jgi:hypothetical protein
MSTVKITQHETSVETRTMGYDHNPYAVNATGIPPEVAQAQREGLGLYLPEFDARQIDWSA